MFPACQHSSWSSISKNGGGGGFWKSGNGGDSGRKDRIPGRQQQADDDFDVAHASY
jgi:hypothetical protein